MVTLLALSILGIWLLQGMAYAEEGGPTGEAEFFEETGHYVGGAFLKRYRHTPAAALVYGYPITEAFQQEDGSYWQYFQRAVMTLAPGAQEVALLPLGAWFYEQDRQRATPPAFPASGAGCTTYGPQAIPVCYLFRSMYEQVGGQAILGWPVSPMVVVDGWVVQYFQLGRMEFHPEAALGHQVTFSPLGERWFYYSGEDPALLLAPQGNQIMAPQRNLHIRAYVRHLTLWPGQEQEVYVTAQDEWGRPVPGVTVMLQWRPLGKERQPTPASPWAKATNEHGFAHLVLPWDAFAGLDPGEWVRLDVRAEKVGAPSLTAKTYVDFRLWGR